MDTPDKSLRNRYGLLPVLAALPFLLCAHSTEARLAKGKLDGISLDPATHLPRISGWACKVAGNGENKPTDQDMDIHLYAVDENATPPALGDLVGFYGGDGNGNIVNGPPWQASAAEADECGLSGTPNLRFIIPISATVEAAHAGKRLRAYALCRPGSQSCTPTEIYMDASKPNITPYLAYRFSAASNPSGWSDLTNYFTAWGCRAPSGGINTIRRLNIAPIGSHTANTWKDSLHVDFNEYVGGNPVVYFTGGSAFSTPTFRLQRATFNGTTGNWSIADFDANYLNGGGISSNDGTATDYIVNVYGQDGWGPSANRSGSVSNIPGVSTTAVGGEYPLTGSGTHGMSTIRALHGSAADPNTQSCLHMNPSLFDYDVNGHPKGLMACLWTGNSSAAHPWPTDGCALPPGVNGTASESAHYVYRHNASTGWQLDPEPLDALGNCAEVGTVNYIQGSTEKFYVTRWEGRIDLLDLPTRNVTQGVLDCTATSGSAVVNFAEASGQPNQIYFIATEPGQLGPSNGLYDGMPTHDIYVGFRVP